MSKFDRGAVSAHLDHENGTSYNILISYKEGNDTYNLTYTLDLSLDLTKCVKVLQPMIVEIDHDGLAAIFADQLKRVGGRMSQREQRQLSITLRDLFPTSFELKPRKDEG